jgi:hypothetical protein
MHVTSQTLPDPQYVLEVGFEPWNTNPFLLCSIRPLSLSTPNKVGCGKTREKARLNLRDIEFYPDPKKYSAVREFISNHVSSLSSISLKPHATV